MNTVGTTSTSSQNLPLLNGHQVEVASTRFWRSFEGGYAWIVGMVTQHGIRHRQPSPFIRGVPSLALQDIEQETQRAFRWFTILATLVLILLVAAIISDRL